MKIVTSISQPGSQAISCGKNLWIVADVVPGVAARAPIRDDLPRDHPLYGKRAVKNVPAGWPDIIDDDAKGVLTCDAKGATHALGTAIDDSNDDDGSKLPIGDAGKGDSGDVG